MFLVPGLGLDLLGGLKWFLLDSEEKGGGGNDVVVWFHLPLPAITEPLNDLDLAAVGGGFVLDGE